MKYYNKWVVVYNQLKKHKYLNMKQVNTMRTTFHHIIHSIYLRVEVITISQKIVIYKL
jgi:hypothetical protein